MTLLQRILKVYVPPRLRWALGMSLVLHAILLAMNFGMPEGISVVREKALDIVLVNSRSALKPVDPQALAQANLDGGGNTDENRRAATPLPTTQNKLTGNEIEQSQRRIQELESKQRELASKAGVQRNAPTETKRTEQRQPTPTLSGVDLAESARAMARLESEINRSLDEYNKRPRKKSIGARTEEYRFARYIEDWRAKVERIGTLNYPEAARGKVYGSLILTVAINADGGIHRIEINRSSGFPLLDEAAQRIVRMAGPYSPFPPDIRRDIDILEITRTWTFTSSNEVQAN